MRSVVNLHNAAALPSRLGKHVAQTCRVRMEVRAALRCSLGRDGGKVRRGGTAEECLSSREPYRSSRKRSRGKRLRPRSPKISDR